METHSNSSDKKWGTVALVGRQHSGTDLIHYSTDTVERLVSLFICITSIFFYHSLDAEVAVLSPKGTYGADLELCGEPPLSARVLMKLISGGQKASLARAHTLLATLLLMHQCPVSCESVLKLAQAVLS